VKHGSVKALLYLVDSTTGTGLTTLPTSLTMTPGVRGGHPWWTGVGMSPRRFVTLLIAVGVLPATLGPAAAHDEPGSPPVVTRVSGVTIPLSEEPARLEAEQPTPSFEVSSTRVAVGEVIRLSLSGCPPPGWDVAYPWTAIVSGGTEGTAGAFRVQDPTGATPNSPLVFPAVGVPGPHGVTQRFTMSPADGGTHVVSFPILPGASSGYFFVDCISEVGIEAGWYRMTSAFVEVIPSSEAAVPRPRPPSFTG
jgi:hypothetical protein